MENELHYTQIVYAGFWQRAVAMFIDFIIFIMLSVAFGLFLMLAVEGGVESETLHSFVIIVFSVIWVLYYALLQSSPWQATIGKKIMKIKVTDLNVQRITFARALMREIIKNIPYVILISWVPMLITEKKQALYDLMSGTVVVDNYFRY